MYFSALPKAYASIGEGLYYTLSDCSEPEVTLIVRRDDGYEIGSKRLLKSSTHTIDIAPMLRHLARYGPERGPTGFCEASDRTLTLQVEAADQEMTIISERRTFLFAMRPVEAPALITSLPTRRRIAPDGYDELTLFDPEPQRITVIAHQRGILVPRSYESEEGGLQLFRLSAADFEGADSLEVITSHCGTLYYTLTPRTYAPLRLAWRTDQGSIEHYTFFSSEQQKIITTKQQIYTADGYRTTRSTTERQLLLHAHPESAAVGEALGELLSAEAVWLATREGYRPVDVVTRELTLHHSRVADKLSFAIRSTHKEQPLWS